MSEDYSKPVKPMKPLAGELEHARRELERINAEPSTEPECEKCYGSGMELYDEGGYMKSRRCSH